MSIDAPVSSIMTTDLMVVNADDKLLVVKNIMDNHEIHHVPVLRFNKLVGLISKTDLSYFLRGISADGFREEAHRSQLENLLAEEIMTQDLETLGATDSIKRVVEIFQKNKFHAIPIVDEEEGILGIVTTFDIINKLIAK